MNLIQQTNKAKQIRFNRIKELEVFVTVIESGSFTAAANLCGMTPSAVSKLVSRLEERLSTRLVNRSTRFLKLTSEGCVFYERGVRILSDLDEAEFCASNHELPKGKLRINTNSAFGYHYLLPVINEFLQTYPQIKIDLICSDESVHIIEQRTDIAIKFGSLNDSNLIGRKLGLARMVIIGSPNYFERHGKPISPEDLLIHNCLELNCLGANIRWPFKVNKEIVYAPINGSIQVSDSKLLHELTLRGVGLARLPYFQVSKDILSGNLIPINEEENFVDYEEIYAIYIGQGGHIPLRVSVFIDFILEKINII